MYTISTYLKIIITKILNHLLLNDVFEILLGYIMNLLDWMVFLFLVQEVIKILKHYFLAIWLQLMCKFHFKFQSQVIFDLLFSVNEVFKIPSARLLGVLYQ